MMGRFIKTLAVVFTLAVMGALGRRFWRVETTDPLNVDSPPLFADSSDSTPKPGHLADVQKRRTPSPDVPLALGARLPALQADGWVNNRSPATEELTGRVLVVDVFDDLCPVCTATAPELIEVYQKYQADDVVFIGLTYAEREPAERFVREAGIPWPVAYGAGTTIAELVGPAPTVFVVGRSGRIFWHDDRARFRHKVAHFQGGLDRAIGRALREVTP